MRTASLTASPARSLDSGIERLQAQRQAAAAARAHASALQVKVVVALGCVLSSVLGYALHRGAAKIAPPQFDMKVSADPLMADPQIGQVQLPYGGDKCRQYYFDNKSGTMTRELVVACAAAELQPSASGPSRAEAIMSAFRVSR